MKFKLAMISTLCMLAAVGLSFSASGESPRMKYATEIPANVITPDKMETRIGTLHFKDGVPSKETAQKLWDQQDFSRAVEAMIMTTPTASLQRFFVYIRYYGPLKAFNNKTWIPNDVELVK